jgi:hypothetical protein
MCEPRVSRGLIRRSGIVQPLIESGPYFRLPTAPQNRPNLFMKHEDLLPSSQEPAACHHPGQMNALQCLRKHPLEQYCLL